MEQSDYQDPAAEPPITGPGVPLQSAADAAAEPRPVDDDDDLEPLSDISDNSDPFHVSAKVIVEPKTDEDKDLQIEESIVPHLREYPLLPPDRKDPTQSFTDLSSCKQLPVLHCGFKGCMWSHKSDVITFHFDMDRLVYCHLAEVHKREEMATVPDSEWDDEQTISRSERPWQIPLKLHALAYYIAAICMKERTHIHLS